MKIYLASGNAGKKREMQQLLPDYEIVTPKDEGIAFDPEETGSNFYENSMIKARALWELVHAPVLADDSGICVDALDGAPGVWSARYAGPEHMKGLSEGSKISQDMQNKFLIEQTTSALKEGARERLSGGASPRLFASGPRSAHYSCSMVLFLSPDRFYIAQETMEGSLIEDIKYARGTGGFGYDPIILIPAYNRTVAELSADEKNAVSHRGKATRAILKILRDVL